MSAGGLGDRHRTRGKPVIKLLCIATGGAAGALLRYGLGGWVQRASGGSFPWGTLSVNLLGCLVVGLLWAVLDVVEVSANVRAMLLVGLLGAFTTFSTFSLEGLQLIENRQYALAVGYLGGSCLGGLVLVLAGLLAGRGLMAAIR